MPGRKIVIRPKSIESPSGKGPVFEAEPLFAVTNYSAVMIDLDHTLARYRRKKLHVLCYNLIVDYLVKRNYPRELFHEFSQLDLEFAEKGIFYDKRRGITAKLDENGRVLRAFFGTRPMTLEEIEDAYDTCYPDVFRSSIGRYDQVQHHSQRSVFCHEDFFTVGTIYLVMVLVQALNDGKMIHYGYQKPMDDVLDGFEAILHEDNFDLNIGGFYPALKQNPDQYLKRLPYEFRVWAKHVRANNMAIVIITNKKADFAWFVLDYVFGVAWRYFVDSVISSAQKPFFFSSGSGAGSGSGSGLGSGSGAGPVPVPVPVPFREVDGGGCSRRSITDVSQFQRYTMYSNGNYADLRHILAAANGRSVQRVLFIADHFTHDIFTTKQLADCDAFAIVEELTDYHYSRWGSYLVAKRRRTFWRGLILKSVKGIASSIMDLAAVKPNTPHLCSTNKIQIFAN